MEGDADVDAISSGMMTVDLRALELMIARVLQLRGALKCADDLLKYQVGQPRHSCSLFLRLVASLSLSLALSPTPTHTLKWHSTADKHRHAPT